MTPSNIIARVAGMELLGEIVTWDMPPGKREIPIGDLRTALIRAGLGEDCLKALDLRTAFSRACAALKKDRTIDRLETNGDIRRFQFTRKYLDSGVFEFSFETVVTLNTATGDIHSDDYGIETHARSLVDHHLGHRNTSDVTRMVQAMFAAQADLAAISDKGVAYFVPALYRDFSERVETFLAAFGGRLNRFPIPCGTREGNESVARTVKAELERKAEKLKSAIADWSASTKDGTMDRKTEEVRILKAQFDAYGVYLGSLNDDVATIMSECDSLLREKIMEVHAAKAVKAEDSLAMV